jgi:prepilin-type N-terminal cleavage/methylation domain-containing protein
MKRRTNLRSGFSLIEVLICSAVLAIAVMGHALTVLAGQRDSVRSQERGLALSTLQRFIERLRGDNDFAGLYLRLKPLTAESAGDGGLTFLGPDPSLPMHPVTDYYADFVTPSTLGTVEVLVQVPVKNGAGGPALREDQQAPRYGLPADLNADGVADQNSHSADYRALPVVVHLRWTRPGGSQQEVVAAAWLRETD